MNRKPLIGLMVFGLLSVSTSMASANEADAALKALDDALPGSLIHNPMDIQWAPSGSDLKTKVVPAEALPTGQAISARNKKKQDQIWNSHLSMQIPQAVSQGEVIEIYYWMRTVKPRAGQDTANVTLFLGRNEAPYDYIVIEEILPDKEWALKSVKGTAPADFPAGQIKLEYQLGSGGQTVEIGPVYVSTLSPSETS